MGQPKYQNDGSLLTSGPGFGLALHEDTLSMPFNWRSPSIVFVNSMSDLFHDAVPLEFIQKVFQVMVETPHHTYQVLTKRSRRLLRIAEDLPWPSNVWMGVSVENQRYTFRAEHLKMVPSAVRFLSVEPLLGPVNLDLGDIDWVIVGGESGPGARPIRPEWVIQIRDQCLRSETAFFFKQWGGRTPKQNGRMLDGQFWDQMPSDISKPKSVLLS